MVTIRSRLVGADETTPELPRAAVDTTYDTAFDAITGANLIDVDSEYSGDLQAAIDAAILLSGDVVIQLTAGSTYSSAVTDHNSYRLKERAGTNFIYITSSNFRGTPSVAVGTRVAPGDTANMAKVTITTGSGLPIFATNFSAHHYRLVGINMEVDAISPQMYQLVRLSWGWDDVENDAGFNIRSANGPTELADNIIFDRCIFHSTDDTIAGKCQSAILMDGTNIGVVECYAYNIKDTQDAQALVAWYAPGPYHIENNYLEATGENIMFGGGGEAYSTGSPIPSDITVLRNHLKKNAAWETPNLWSVKNLFELKVAVRAHVHSNVMENNWVDAQNGTAVLFTARNQSGTMTWAQVSDILFENNIIKNSTRGFLILGEDDIQSSQQTTRLKFRNNLMFGIFGEGSSSSGQGVLFTTPDLPLLYCTFTHNTFMHVTATVGQSAVTSIDNRLCAKNVILTDNVMSFGDYGTATLTRMDPLTMEANGFVFDSASSRYAYNQSIWATEHPNDFKADAIADAKFVDEANDDYEITDNTSPFWLAASDGANIGVDFTELNAAVSGVDP